MAFYSARTYKLFLTNFYSLLAGLRSIIKIDYADKSAYSERHYLTHP